MSSAKKLTLNGNVYNLGLSQDKTIQWASLTAYEKKVLQFCQRWLQGQQTFNLNTSGSTGKAKVISLSREQMVASAKLTGQTFNLQAGDQALVCLSTEYIAGMMMLVRGFVLGLGLTVVTPSNNPLAFFDEAAQFDFTAMVPLQLQQILTHSPAKKAVLDRMKAILVGGAPISRSLLKQLQGVNAPVYHTYGMTETVTHVAVKALNGPQASDYFRPLAGVDIGLDERGCLKVKGAVTGGKWLCTNDVVSLLKDTKIKDEKTPANGGFRWVGRIDNVINSGGVKVLVEQVERALQGVFEQFEEGGLAQRRFFVGAVTDSRFGEMVIAVVEGEAFEVAVEQEIKSLLVGRLNKYEIPRRFCFIERLLETPTGKVDRKGTVQKIIEGQASQKAKVNCARSSGGVDIGCA